MCYQGRQGGPEEAQATSEGTGTSAYGHPARWANRKQGASLTSLTF